MHKGLIRRIPVLGIIPHNPSNQIHQPIIATLLLHNLHYLMGYLPPVPGLYPGKPKLTHIIAVIHGQDLLDSGRPQHPDNLHKLVDIIRGDEQRLAGYHLDEDAAGRPHVDLCGVVGRPED